MTTIKLITTLVTLLLIQACDSSSNNTGGLEGRWESFCLLGNVDPAGPSSLGPPPIGAPTMKLILHYQNGSIITSVDNYADADCSDLVSTVGIEEGIAVPRELLAVSYEVGPTVTTSNGVTARELDLYDSDGILYPQIFLLRENDTQLYFGLKCSGFADPPEPDCLQKRPTEIFYDFYYTRRN